MASKDKRRFDERVPVNSEPFWFTSSILTPADVGVDAVLKSFEALAGTHIVLAAGLEVIEAFNGSASFVAGIGTMPTKAIGTVTAVDDDQLLISTDVTEATVGYYPQIGSQLGTDLGIGKQTVIKGADATVPVLYGVMTATGATTGKCRLHVLLAKVPVA